MVADREACEMTPRHAKQYVTRFREVTILVIGDLMVDHYLWGKVSRISPEAPVPVVDVTSESIRLGGAANVLNNLLALGGRGYLCGIIGQDGMGRTLLRDLRKRGVDTSGIVVQKSRPTTTKTRIIAHSQQVVRFDHELRSDITEKSQKMILHCAQAKMKEMDCLVISDYAKGVVTGALIKDLLALAREYGKQVVVDPKVKNLPLYKGVTVITPNTLEAAQSSGIDIVDDKSLVLAGTWILNRLSCDAVLITRGEQGMSLFERNGEVIHIPTVAKGVFDVTGAGDTVVCTLALALSAGASMKEAAVLANHAAGIVVGVVGTATATQEMLQRSFS